MQTNYLDMKPEEIMASHGKSFFWASQFFSRSQLHNVSVLYTFCRFIDDLADENKPDIAEVELQKISIQIQGSIEHHLIKKIISLGVKTEYIEELIDGALFDTKKGMINSHEELLVYCYKVAGVVGLMMCPVLGVVDRKAYAHAIDLGVGMQLTNICRDVLEDAQNNRYYLPLNELKEIGINKEHLKKAGAHYPQLSHLVKKYLLLADQYYESASLGFAYIPLRPRLAILIASNLYHAIGVKILKNDCNVLKGRTYLNKWEKLIKTIWALKGIFRPSFWIKGDHDIGLHIVLKGLPGVEGP
jgi:15-cis-phytoene synthase